MRPAQLIFAVLLTAPAASLEAQSLKKIVQAENFLWDEARQESKIHISGGSLGRQALKLRQKGEEAEFRVTVLEADLSALSDAARKKLMDVPVLFSHARLEPASGGRIDAVAFISMADLKPGVLKSHVRHFASAAIHCSEDLRKKYRSLAPTGRIKDPTPAPSPVSAAPTRVEKKSKAPRAPESKPATNASGPLAYFARSKRSWSVDAARTRADCAPGTLELRQLGYRLSAEYLDLLGGAFKLYAEIPSKGLATEKGMARLKAVGLPSPKYQYDLLPSGRACVLTVLTLKGLSQADFDLAVERLDDLLVQLSSTFLAALDDGRAQGPEAGWEKMGQRHERVTQDMVFWWDFKTPPGKRWRFRVSAGQGSVFDAAIVDESGMAAYRQALDNDGGSIPTLMIERNSGNATLEWTAPGNAKYYLVVDNTRLVSGGAYAGRDIEVDITAEAK